MKNLMKWAKNWNIILQSIQLHSRKKIHLWGRHTVCWKYTSKSISMFLGQKAPKKLDLTRKNFFGIATLLIEVLYLNCQPISWHFPFFRTPCEVKMHFEKEKLPLLWGRGLFSYIVQLGPKLQSSAQVLAQSEQYIQGGIHHHSPQTF